MSTVAGQAADAGHGQGRRVLTVRRGIPFHIHLWEDRTRGELWVPTYDSSSLVLISDEYLRIASGNAVDSGRRTFEFKPVALGTSRLVFEKRLGWKFTAEDRHIYEITTADAPAGAC
jgi:predicted secreted protein